MPRSILLIILLLLIILSVSTDSQMLDGLTAGLRWSGGGLFFSVLVLESLRRILKIRLAPRFLAAAYFMLALFFLYPVLNARLIAMYPDDRLPGVLAILFFPVAAAAALLGFLPYLHQKSIPESGTPWKTPYFPWSIVALLGAGALFPHLSVDHFFRSGARDRRIQRTGKRLHALDVGSCPACGNDSGNGVCNASPPEYAVPSLPAASLFHDP